MTVTSVEIKGSRSGRDATDRSSTAELIWLVSGSNTPADIKSHMDSVVPSTYDGLVYRSIEWEHLGNGQWQATANYVHPDRSDRDNVLDTGDYTFSFDTSGGTVTRSVSLGTTKYAKSGETAADFKSAINVTKEGVDGVEIGIPALKFSIRKRIAKASITLAYVKTLASMTYTTNDDTFMGFAAGELLFIGATGQEGTNTDPEITYNFIASSNSTGLTVGEITGVAKKGHEYLWAYFEDAEDAAAVRTVKRPLSCYVEKVYDESDFDALGI